ncbi:hypothetical protein KIN20_020179 [Parelaphostrongylus tenuis]|uniref:Uncharacterized protein n=1 Tax=Parelaphostrongylus tenuis TaxID=148309 RepID=A0AAD5N3T5_PARTN|nr:hypothetical protein KIN20_020179 [Parelaphostrongylus tenuis]
MPWTKHSGDVWEHPVQPNYYDKLIFTIWNLSVTGNRQINEADFRPYLNKEFNQFIRKIIMEREMKSMTFVGGILFKKNRSSCHLPNSLMLKIKISS